MTSLSDLPSTAEAVIIGGGVMGVSTAYHLAAAGMREVVGHAVTVDVSQLDLGRFAEGRLVPEYNVV